MALSADTSQAIAVSRALRKAGWNPASSYRYAPGLTVRRGSCGMGASVCLSSASQRQIDEWSQAMDKDLTELGYAFDRSELQSDVHGHTVWFRRVKKIEKTD